MFAVDAYQIILKTLGEAKSAMGLTGEEKLTPDLQNRIFEQFLSPKAGGGALVRYLTKGVGTADQAQYAAAKEWASVAVPSLDQLK